MTHTPGLHDGLTLVQKLARNREQKRDRDIAERSGATARYLHKLIEGNPFSTSKGQTEHQLAMAWLHG